MIQLLLELIRKFVARLEVEVTVIRNRLIIELSLR